MTTTTITITMDHALIERLRKLAEKEKQKKGFLGKTISAATKKFLDEKEQEHNRQHLLNILAQGHHMGRFHKTKREDLHER